MSSKTKKELKDSDVRGILVDSLIDELKTQFERDKHPARIIPEFCICGGGARVDIATINGNLCGYEIKSDADTLERLPSQMTEYNKVFDFVTLVVGDKLLFESLNMIPDWWGVRLFKRMRSGELRFYDIRECERNPQQSVPSVLNLLRREEIVKLAHNKKISGYSHLNKVGLCKIVTDEVATDELLAYARRSLIKNRASSRSDQLLQLCDERYRLVAR